jgi:hypothetical protein
MVGLGQLDHPVGQLEKAVQLEQVVTIDLARAGGHRRGLPFQGTASAAGREVAVAG